MEDRNVLRRRTRYLAVCLCVVYCLLTVPAFAFEDIEWHTLNLFNRSRSLEGGGALLGIDGEPMLEEINRLNNLEMLSRQKSGHYVPLQTRWNIVDNYPAIEMFDEVACYFPFIPTAQDIFLVFAGSQSHWDALMNPNYNTAIVTVQYSGSTAAVTIMLLEVKEQ